MILIVITTTGLQPGIELISVWILYTTPSDVDSLHSKHQVEAKRSDYTIIHSGSGWGALEVTRREVNTERPVPQGFKFPNESLGPQQNPWFSLLTKPGNAHFPLDLKDSAISWITDLKWEKIIRNEIDFK